MSSYLILGMAPVDSPVVFAAKPGYGQRAGVVLMVSEGFDAPARFACGTDEFACLNSPMHRAPSVVLQPMSPPARVESSEPAPVPLLCGHSNGVAGKSLCVQSRSMLVPIGRIVSRLLLLPRILARLRLCKNALFAMAHQPSAGFVVVEVFLNSRAGTGFAFSHANTLA